MTSDNKPPILIRKAADWYDRPVWRWRCRLCPRPKGRKPVGGDHHVVTLVGLRRPDYPTAWERCLSAAMLHVHVAHNREGPWGERVKRFADRVCQVRP